MDKNLYYFSFNFCKTNSFQHSASTISKIPGLPQEEIAKAKKQPDKKKEAKKIETKKAKDLKHQRLNNM